MMPVFDLIFTSGSVGMLHLIRPQEAHWEVCERILHIFALLNPGTYLTFFTLLCFEPSR